MAMGYRDFRDLARGMGGGLDEVVRQELGDGRLIVVIGKRSEAVFPSVTGHPMVLKHGEDTIFEDEEVASHCRALNRYLGRNEDDSC